MDSRLDVSSDLVHPTATRVTATSVAARAMRVCMGGFLSIVDAG